MLLFASYLRVEIECGTAADGLWAEDKGSAVEPAYELVAARPGTYASAANEQCPRRAGDRCDVIARRIVRGRSQGIQFRYRQAVL